MPPGLFFVPFLMALFWGACRNPAEPGANKAELDIRYAVCGFSSSMALALLISTLVEIEKKSR